MRYFELLKTIKNISTTHVLVNEYGEGDIYEHLNSGEHKYPCVFLTVTNIESSVSSTLYNFTLFYTDRLVESGDNRTNIQSTGINVIQQILNRLTQEYPTYEVTNINFTPFTEKFADMCAGVFCDVTFEDPVENLESTIDSECNEGDFEIQTITLTKNGLYDVIGYDRAIVAIPLTELEITEEGTYINDNGGWNKVTVGEMAKVQEHVEVEINDIANEWTYITPDEGYDGIGEVAIHNTTINKLHTKSQTITSNGTYSISPNSGYKGMSKVTVNVNTPTPTQLTVTQNGTWTRSGGYSPVIVNTPKYEIISLNQKQYNELEDYNEFAVYLITYDNTIPSVEGDYFYIEAQNETLLSFNDSLLYYNSEKIEYSIDSYTWNPLSEIVNTGITLKKFDRIFFRNIEGEIYNTSSTDGLRLFAINDKNITVIIGGDLHTVMFKYTDKVYTLTNEYCFARLFNTDTQIIEANDLILPATTLSKGCYYGMFEGCTSLTTAPELPATILADNCYYGMFNGCSNLSSITCYATEISATNCTYDWVNGVSSTGTFYKHPDMNDWTSGQSGIPSGWTVENANIEEI